MLILLHQAEALSLRADHEKLQDRLRLLETSAIPAATRDVSAAEARLAHETRDAATRVRVATQEVEGAQARLQRLDAERRALAGEQGGRGHG